MKHWIHLGWHALLLGMIACTPKTLISKLYVGGQAPCEDSGQASCLLTRQDPQAAWILSPEIEGFQYVEGFEYNLEVEGRPRKGGQQQYRLLRVIDKKAIKTEPKVTLLNGLDKKTWTLLELYRGGSAIAIEAGQITLEIDQKNNRFSGQAPCNRYFGGINLLSEDKLMPGPAASTRRACTNAAANALETEYLGLISSVNRYQITEGKLRLYQDEVLILVFE